MAAKKTHDLAVKVGEYTDSAGAKKGRWLTVGRVMSGDDGSEFWLIDKTFCPAGVPDWNGKGGDSVLLSKFPVRDRQPGPGEHQQAKANGYAPQPAAGHAFGHVPDDLPF